MRVALKSMVELAEISAKILLSSKCSQLLQNGHLAAIQRPPSAENAFEVNPEVVLPLYCKLPASKGTMCDLLNGDQYDSLCIELFFRSRQGKHCVLTKLKPLIIVDKSCIYSGC